MLRAPSWPPKSTNCKGSFLAVPSETCRGVAPRLGARPDSNSLKCANETEFGPHGLAPERVAAQVLRAVQRDRPRVVVGLDYHLVDVLVRLAPDWSLGQIARWVR
jgi:hypothetical protein